MTKQIKIGFLATGNELTEGDILNTNGQMIARMLVDQGLPIGMHAIASDMQTEIEQALDFLLQHHSVVITIGGLGPTSDDRTRYALSKVLNKELLFDEASWQHILTRYKRIGVEPHPDNRQQALFPQGAHIIANPNGTAAGCWIEHNKKIIYMLPGPPSECLPMFAQTVLPKLLSETNLNKRIKLKWYLLGAIESEIAALVDTAMKPYPVITGYRIDFPYLEVKIDTESHPAFAEMQTLLEQILAPHVISKDNKSASELLKQIIADFAGIITIDDNATFGALESALTTPATHNQLHFIRHAKPRDFADLHISITGLEDYWRGQQSITGTTTLNLQLTQNNTTENINITIPFRNVFVLKYAVEFISRELLQYLKGKP